MALNRSTVSKLIELESYLKKSSNPRELVNSLINKAPAGNRQVGTRRMIPVRKIPTKNPNNSSSGNRIVAINRPLGPRATRALKDPSKTIGPKTRKALVDTGGTFTPVSQSLASGPSESSGGANGLSVGGTGSSIAKKIASQYGNKDKDFIFDLPPSGFEEGHAKDDLQRAEDLVELEYDPLIDQLKRAREQTKRARDLDIAVQKEYGEEGDIRLKEIADALSEELESNLQRTKGIFTKAQEDTARAYGNVIQEAAQATGEVREELLAEAKRLGIEAGLGDPLEQLSSELSALQSRAEESQAGAVGDITSLGVEFEGLGLQAKSDAAAEMAESRAGLVQDVQRAITEAQYVHGDRLAEIQGQLVDLEGRRGVALRNALVEVQEARTEQERQAKLDRLAEEIQRNSIELQERQLGLQERQFGLDVEESLFNRNLALEQLEADKRALEAEIAAANSPEARLRSQLELQKLDAEIRKIEAQTANVGFGGGAGRPKGQSGVQQYLEYWNAPSDFKAYANDVISRATSHLGSSSGYNAAMHMVRNDPNYPDEYRQDLATIVNIFFGNY